MIEIWTRRFGDEYLSDCCTPLGHTLLVCWISDELFRAFARMAGRDELARRDPIRLYRGHAYLSGRWLAELMRSFPPGARTLAVGDWFPPSWADAARGDPFEPWALARAARAPLGDRVARPGENPRALARHADEIARRLGPRLGQDDDALGEAEWRRQLAEMDALGRAHFRVIRWGMAIYNPLLHAAARALLARWAGDDGALYRAAVGGIEGARTAEQNRDLWRLGRLAREGGTKGRPFAEALAAFLARHGHRAAGRDISQPRWREAPGDVLALVGAQLAGAPPPDPALAQAEAARRRDAAEAEAVGRLGRGPLAAARGGVIRGVLARARVYTRYREDQRYQLDYILMHARRLALAAGRRLAAAGVLGTPDDVFFLEAAELDALVAAPRPSTAVAARVDERRRDFERWRQRLPPTWLAGDAPLDEPAAAGAPGALAGVAASSGVARGRVRVVRELAELASVLPGEVLVTRTTDPAWTSVFPRLGALVTETGGILSHGAVLAREYGLPAVAGVAGATERLATSELVEVDGGRGTVRLLG